LDLFTRMPVIIGQAPDSDAALLYADIAATMGWEGVLDGLDWNDARGAVAAMAFDLMERGGISSWLAFLGVPSFDVDLEFSGGVSQPGFVDVAADVPVDGVQCLA